MKGLTEQLLSNINFKNERLGMFFSVQDYGGWGGSVILVRHNLNIVPQAEHNFEHNTLVSQVTPESIILYFSSVIRQNLILGNNNRRRKKIRQGKQKKKQKTGTCKCRKMSRYHLYWPKP